MNKYEKYKDSGIQWLGQIPEHWETIRLANIGRFSSSGIDKLILKNESKVKIVNYTDVYRNSRYVIDSMIEFMEVSTPENNRLKNLVKRGDLIYLPSSETFEDLGLCALIDEDIDNLSFSYHVLRFEFKKDIDHNFKKYFTNNSTILNEFSKKGTGSIRKTLNRNDFRNIIVVLPPLSEQTAIANFLDDKTAKIDQAIAIKEKEIVLLKERRQILIQQAVTKGLDATVPMKHSGVDWIGEIPKHWEVRKLRNCLRAVSVKNKAHMKLLSITREKGVIVRDKDNTEENHNFIPDDLSGYKMIKKGQFGMNKMKAWQGSYGISNYDGIVSPAYYIFDVTNKFTSEYFHLAIRSSVYIPFFVKASDGVRIGQWDLNKTRMNEIPFFIPSNKEQIEIVMYIEEMEAKIAKAIALKEQEIEKLKEYKTVLIDNVVTGKVRVS